MAEAQNGGAPGGVWSAEQVRRARGEPVELPSGIVVRMRTVSAVDLAASGVLPDPLSQHVFRDMAEVEGELTTPAERQRARLEKVEAINAVVCAVIAEPRVVPDPQGGAPTPEAFADGALYVSELPWRDRVHVFNLACGQVEAGLARFRDEPAGALPPAPDGDGLLDAAERDPRTAAG